MYWQVGWDLVFDVMLIYIDCVYIVYMYVQRYYYLVGVGVVYILFDITVLSFLDIDYTDIKSQYYIDT